jgi:hypothetical protein
MNYISYAHKNVGTHIPGSINNPEEYFGPNYRALLNFWLYWESLSWEQRVQYERRAKECDYEYRANVLNLIVFYVETKLTRRQLSFFQIGT